MFYVLLSVIVPWVIYRLLNWNRSERFHDEIKRLFTMPATSVARAFRYDDLENLPPPVQRYFKHVLKDGQPYIRSARITHTGKFKTNLKKDWIDIHGEEYFTTEKPGFLWKGVTRWFTACDQFIDGKGGLTVSLLSLFNIVHACGNKYDQGELLRWLGESIWFPTNLLPSANLEWFAIDKNIARLIYHYNELTLNYTMTFNDSNEIIQMETMRFKDNGDLETWLGKISDYRELNNIVVPCSIEACWRLNEIEYSYARFDLDRIEYDKANAFGERRSVWKLFLT